MSKEIEYEVNNFANLLHKDCMNLMECLKKQGEDNKPILYLDKHYKKVILPYEEYQKMHKRLESIDNANPSEALECLEKVYSRLPQWDLSRNVDQCNIIKQALLKAQKEHKALDIIKEKDVDIYILNHCKTVDEYNSKIVHIIGEIRELTQDEFDILKRC